MGLGLCRGTARQAAEPCPNPSLGAVYVFFSLVPSLRLDRDGKLFLYALIPLLPLGLNILTSPACPGCSEETGMLEKSLALSNGHSPLSISASSTEEQVRSHANDRKVAGLVFF